MPNSSLEFGARLKQSRTDSEFTQADVAWAVGVSVKQVSFWECGKASPRAAVLPALANVLGVSVDWLLGREDGR